MEAIVTTGSPPPLRLLTLPDGRRIACAEFGDPSGVPVLALHGTPGSRLMFALADKAARTRGIRLIAPERPGYGLSDYRPAASLAHIAGDLSEVADAYGLDRFAIIGVSGGAPFAVAAAASMPDRISLLALVCPVGELANGQLRLSRFQRCLFRRLAHRPWATRLFFRRLRTMVFRSPDSAYRWLMARLRAPDRELLARPEVRASLQAAMSEGLRPGPEGAAQDFGSIAPRGVCGSPISMCRPSFGRGATIPCCHLQRPTPWPGRCPIAGWMSFRAPGIIGSLPSSV